jgi:molybdate transport system substrate-binding protein
MRSYRVITALFITAAIAAGCGSSSKGSSSSSSKPTGNLNVLAAASLTSAFTNEKSSLEAAHPGLHITNDFAGTQQLVEQLQQGAPADVFASADQAHMQTLVDAGLVNAPQVFAKNKLEIAVAPGNPKHITGLADLEKPGVVLVLADPSVPAGKYAAQAFQQAGLPAPKPKSLELDVKSTLAKLTQGEADAVVVYVTDVQAAGDKVQGVEIPANQNVIATYPIAVVKASKNQAAAQAFVNDVLSGGGQQTLRSQGFLPPN